MQINAIDIELRGNAIRLTAETTRGQLVELVGEADDIGAISRKAKRGRILKYDETEFHFDGHRDDSLLVLVYREHEINGEWYPDLSVKFDPGP